MNSRSTPALAHALEHIEALRRAGAARGERIPTVGQLARQAGVSPRTMHTAVRLLSNAGLLTVRQRSGIQWLDPSVVVPLPAVPAVPAVHRGRAGRLVGEIEGDMLSGTVPDPLPSVKELRARYGAGHASVSCALRELAARGSIAHRGRRWVVARTAARAGVSKVMLVAPGDTMAGFAACDTKAAEFCTALERECAMQGTALHFQSLFRPVRPAPSQLGYLVIAGHAPDVVAAALAALQAGNRPAVVVDILGDCPLPNLSRLRRVSVVRIQGARFAGRQVALMLRDMGHRRVAYLSPYTTAGTGWVRDRLLGLRDVYAAGVVVHTGTELVSRGDAEIRVRHDVIPGAKEAVAALARQTDHRNDAADPAWLHDILVSALANRLTESYLQPLCSRAAADRTITAWVGANDEFALGALRFLAQSGIDVPGQISVVGFDGSPTALLAELTTYDFNAPAVAKTALDLVLRPPPGAAIPDARVFDIPGVLAPRSTVSPL